MAGESPETVEIWGRESVEVDPAKPAKLSQTVHKDHLRFAALVSELETNVQYCLSAGIEWLEVEEALLAGLCKGKVPGPGYMVYKNVKLCLPGTAETIARRESLTVHEILFKDDNFKYRVGKAKV